MEDLNKNQFVLLTLLVSFVTSIATGIMTFSLLQSAPIEVTRTINQVVEKTIQQVTPTSILSSPREKEVTTVVVKEEDLVMDSINKNLKSIVRIKERDAFTQASSFYGMGLIATKDGSVVAERHTITAGNTYVGTFSDGTDIELNPIGVDKKTNFIIFKILKPALVKSFTFVPATFADVEPRLGQSVVALGGEDQNAVGVGRVTSFSMKEINTATSSVKYVSGIDTDVVTRDTVSGSPLFNLSGDIVGIKLSENISKSFTPSVILKKELNQLIEP